MLFNRTILALKIFLFISSLSFSQTLKFTGRIEYSYETLLSSGIYKEGPHVNIYFNEYSHFTQQIQKPIDIESLVKAQMMNLKQAYAKRNIPIDSFEIERQTQKLRIEFENKLKERASLPFSIIVYREDFLTTQLKAGNEIFCVQDSLHKPDWILMNDTATIEGLLCQKAKGAISGKKYEVWFTPSVPFPTGPFKFFGLPGIIVLAVSEDKKRRYKMTILEYPLKEYVEIKRCESKKITRSEFVKIQEKYKKERQQQIDELKENHH